MEMSPFESYCQTLDLLVEGRLLQAINLQKEQVKALQDWALMDDIVKTEETYTLMLKYFAEGAEDSRRNDVYNEVLAHTLAMAEKIKRLMGFRNSTSIYYSKVRTIARQGRTLIYYTRRLQMMNQQQLLQNILETDISAANQQGADGRSALIEELFDYIWVAGRMTEEEYEALESLIAGNVVSGGEKMWLVSALTLSLLSYYDLPKLTLLVNIADSYNSNDTSDNAVIYSRAIVGIALAAMYYRRRFMVDHSVSGLLDFMPGVGVNMAMLQTQLLVQYQTRRIRKTFDTDFMSLLNQMRDKIGDLNELRNILEDEDPELPPGLDPEVIHAIQSRLQQANDMAHRGLDMMYHHFRQLKSYPFFRETRNWLKPNSVKTPDFDATLGKVAPLLNLSRMCDSDKHSMAATLASMPQTLGQMIAKQMEELDMQAGQSEDALLREERENIVNAYRSQYSDVPLAEMASEALAYAGNYIQDLYRLFTIRMEKEAEGNPFIASHDLLFLDTPLIKLHLSASETAHVVDYAYRSGLYHQALALIDNMPDGKALSPQNLLRKAFCYAMLKDAQSAVEVFRQYEQMAESEGHMDEDAALFSEMLAVYASCLMSVGQPQEAVRIYHRLFDDGEAVRELSLYPYAVALSQTGCYSDACDVLYQEEYVRPDQPKVVRLLAWCTLRQGDAAQALGLYQRLTDMPSVRPADWLNAGHAALASGNTVQAIGYYRRSRITSFTREDRQLLNSLGVPRLTLSLVEDAVGIAG